MELTVCFGFDQQEEHLLALSMKLRFFGVISYLFSVIMINENVPEDQKHSFRTANMYHFIGTLGLVASSLGRHPLLVWTDE
jgi:hypothetical protein